MKEIHNSLAKFSITLMLLAAFTFSQVSIAKMAPPPPSRPTVEDIMSFPESLPAPTIIAPKNGEAVKGKKVMLKWTAVENATSYSIEMSFREPKGADFVTSGIPVGSSTTTSYEYSLKGIKPGTTIRWLVSAWNAKTGQGGWVSEEAEFSYKKKEKQLKNRP